MFENSNHLVFMLEKRNTETFPQIPLETSHALVEIGQRLSARGWVPATGGNLSVRMPGAQVAITVSGRHKGYLVPDDIMAVDINGQSLDGKKPSAETLLHTGLYKLDATVQAILHGHPRSAVTYSLVFPNAGHITFSNYEFLKVFSGITTHDTSVTIPIFENSQDMPGLQRTIDAWYTAHPGTPPIYVVRGHGLTVGAKSVEHAYYVFEAVEELFAYELAKSLYGAKKV